MTERRIAGESSRSLSGCMLADNSRMIQFREVSVPRIFNPYHYRPNGLSLVEVLRIQNPGYDRIIG